jgi:hypothetical protein
VVANARASVTASGRPSASSQNGNIAIDTNYLPGIATTMTVTATIRISTNSIAFCVALLLLWSRFTRNLINRTKNRMMAALGDWLVMVVGR